VAQAVLADPGSPLRKEEDVYLLLDRLAERGLLRWTLDLPVSLDAERLLAERLTAIGDPEVREAALAGLTRLQDERDAVAAAAGQPDRLAGALAAMWPISPPSSPGCWHWPRRPDPVTGSRSSW
jgi:hypothetical protein